MWMVIQQERMKKKRGRIARAVLQNTYDVEPLIEFVPVNSNHPRRRKFWNRIPARFWNQRFGITERLSALYHRAYRVSNDTISINLASEQLTATPNQPMMGIVTKPSESVNIAEEHFEPRDQEMTDIFTERIDQFPNSAESTPSPQHSIGSSAHPSTDDYDDYDMEERNETYQYIWNREYLIGNDREPEHILGFYNSSSSHAHDDEPDDFDIFDDQWDVEHKVQLQLNF